MSSSSNVVNFGLRHSKSIERSIVFDGLQEVYRTINVENLVYIGFGSVWFSDFQLAHRQLGIDDMISIEWDDVTFKRAVFNKPFRTVEVIHGRSYDVVGDLLQRTDLADRPMVVWLDYDEALDSTKRDELIGLATTLPPNSSLITTFKVLAGNYAKARVRAASLEDLFGEAYEDYGLDVTDQRDFALVLGRNLERDLRSAASRAGRSGPALPSFFLPYRDITPMLTLGVVLASDVTANPISDVLTNNAWVGYTEEEVAAPLLTSKEVAALQSILPSMSPVTRAAIQSAGFDLDEDRLASFCRYYTRYPVFAQISQ